MTIVPFEIGRDSLKASFDIISSILPSTGGNAELPFPHCMVDVQETPKHDRMFFWITQNVREMFADSAYNDIKPTVEWLANGAERIRAPDEKIYIVGMGETDPKWNVPEMYFFLHVTADRKYAITTLDEGLQLSDDTPREKIRKLGYDQLKSERWMVLAFVFLFNLPKYFRQQRAGIGRPSQGVIGERDYRPATPGKVIIDMSYQMRRSEREKRSGDETYLPGMTRVRRHLHKIPIRLKGSALSDPRPLVSMHIGPFDRMIKTEGYEPNKVRKVRTFTPETN